MQLSPRPLQHEVSLLRPQLEFVLDDGKFVIYMGGVGSGKTYAGSHFVIRMVTQYPNCRGFIGANSYKQLHNSVLTRLKAELEQVGFSYHFNALTGILTVEGVEIYTGTLEKGAFNNHRGIEIGWAWCDEIRDLEEEAWLMLMGRLRDNRGPKIMRGTTTPAGFNWIHDHWFGEKKTARHKVVHATSYDNIFLPEGYIESMVASYDEQFLRQEVHGEILNLVAGKVYRAYDPGIVLVEEVAPLEFGEILRIGMDFNVSPMTATVGRIRKRQLEIFDEIWLPDANTYEMRDEILKRYGGLGHPIVIYPDHTGGARKTSAFMSDHQILKKAGFTVRTSQNPLSEDRYNAVNGLMEHGRLKLVRSKTKMLQRDFQQVVHGKNPDHLTHISDGLGYMVWREFPIRSRQEMRSYDT